MMNEGESQILSLDGGREDIFKTSEFFKKEEISSFVQRDLLIFSDDTWNGSQ